MSDLPASSWMKGKVDSRSISALDLAFGTKMSPFRYGVGSELACHSPNSRSLHVVFVVDQPPCLNVVTPILDVVPPGGGVVGTFERN